jgi:uncharacterized protein (TIRG00374 family)
VPWHAVFIGALTIGLLWLFVRNINPREAWDATRHAHLGWIAVACIVTLQTYVLRAARWQILLAPIGRARFGPAFRTTIIGFTASFLLPARIGEVLRPYLLARHERLNAASAFATIVVERILDMITVLLIFGLGIVVLGAAVSTEVRSAGGVAGAAAAAAVLVLVVLAGHPEPMARLTARLARVLPARVAAMVTSFVRTFVEGLRVLRSPSHLILAFAWSIPLWLSLALGIWLTTRAFDLTLPFIGSFLVVGYLAVGVAAPTPGGAGGFHYMYKLAMTQLFAAPESAAAAAAIVLHAVSFVPVTILGLFFMWQDGLTLRGLQRMGAEARSAEAPAAARE